MTSPRDICNATSTTGTYSIGSDGRGTLNLNNSIGQFQFAIAMKALDNAVMNEIDNTVVAGSGNLEAQVRRSACPPATSPSASPEAAWDAGPSTLPASSPSMAATSMGRRTSTVAAVLFRGKL